MPWPTAAVFIVVQILGAIGGCLDGAPYVRSPARQLLVTTRTGPGQWFAEAVATFGLVLRILSCMARTAACVPYSVGLYLVHGLYGLR